MQATIQCLRYLGDPCIFCPGLGGSCTRGGGLDFVHPAHLTAMPLASVLPPGRRRLAAAAATIGGDFEIVDNAPRCATRQNQQRFACEWTTSQRSVMLFIVHIRLRQLPASFAVQPPRPPCLLPTGTDLPVDDVYDRQRC